MIIDGKEYYTFEEIRPMALEQMRKEFKEKNKVTKRGKDTKDHQ